MVSRRRRAPWSAALVVVLVIGGLLGYASPAAASTNWALTANGATVDGCHSTGDGVHLGGHLIDADDTTWEDCGGYAQYGWTTINLGAARAVTGLKVAMACEAGGAGSGNECWTGYTVESYAYASGTCNVNSNSSARTVRYTGTGTTAGVVALDSSATSRCWFIQNTAPASGGVGKHWGLATVELYDTIPVTSVSAGEYIYNAYVTHPQFGWHWGWQWAQSFHGTVDVTVDPAGTFYGNYAPGSALTTTVSYSLAGGFGPDTGDGAISPDFHQDCFPLCQSDSAVMTLVDTDRNQTASFTFLRSASGFVTVPLDPPSIVYLGLCYNATAAQCGTGETVGQVSGSFAFAGGAADCWVGPRAVGIAPAPLGVGNATNYWHYGPGALAADSPFSLGPVTIDAALGKTYQVVCSNPAGLSSDLQVLDTTTGGAATVVVRPPPGGGGGGAAASCGPLDPACAIRAIFEVAGGALREAMLVFVVAGRNAAMEKQPFNFIVRAFDGVTTQLDRARTDLGSTSTCSGVTMVLPSLPPIAYTGLAGATTAPSWPSSVPQPSFTVLRCADFEPWGGTSWWQAIRAAMDPAIYLLWGLREMRKLEPRTTLGG